MRMTEALDAGDVLLQGTESIAPHDTAGTLAERLARRGADLLRESIDGLKAGTIRAQPQDAALVTIAPRIRKEMGRIDWAEPAERIERAIRALHPWPMAYTSLGERHLRILAAHVAVSEPTTTDAPPGTVVQGGDGIYVVTGRGVLVLDAVQIEGRKPLAATTFLHGHPLASGTRLGT
jgi:methionyl-tRNA formyltransferase